MKRAFTILMMMTAILAACNEDFTVSPAISFFPNSPEVKEDSAIFRIAASFLPEDTQLSVPVIFGGSAVRDVDYRASSDHFILGGESPRDSIIIWTLQLETGKDLSLSLELPEGFEFGKYSTAQYTLQDKPAYLGFEKDVISIKKETSLAVSVYDRSGSKKAAPEEIKFGISVDKERSTAAEGTDFILEGASEITIPAGRVSADFSITPTGTPEAGKDKVVLTIIHAEKYGNAANAQIEVTLSAEED